MCFTEKNYFLICCFSEKQKSSKSQLTAQWPISGGAISQETRVQLEQLWEAVHRLDCGEHRDFRRFSVRFSSAAAGLATSPELLDAQSIACVTACGWTIPVDIMLIFIHFVKTAA